MMDHRARTSPASECMAVASRSNLVNELGRHLVRRLCSQLSEAPSAVKETCEFWINLDPRQLERKASVRHRLEMIEAPELEPTTFRFEIGEAALAKQDPGLEHLQAEGYGLVLDDFGTGDASLARFKEVELTGLKIDMTFVHGFMQSFIDRSIVCNILDLSERLGLPVVAEGVETGEQLERLREVGCDGAQGYELGRPRPFDEAIGQLGSNEED